MKDFEILQVEKKRLESGEPLVYSVPAIIKMATGQFMSRELGFLEQDNIDVSYSVSEPRWRADWRNWQSKVQEVSGETAKIYVRKSYILEADKVLIGFEYQQNPAFLLIPFSGLHTVRREETESVFPAKNGNIYHYTCDTIINENATSIKTLSPRDFKILSSILMRREIAGFVYLCLVKAGVLQDLQALIFDAFSENKIRSLNFQVLRDALKQMHNTLFSQPENQIPILEKIKQVYAIDN